MKWMMRAAVLAVMIFAGGGTVLASGDGHGRRERVGAVRDPLVVKECGACHMVYQPQFLPAASWWKIMSGLKDHFGDNATLDADSVNKITWYLTAHAGADRFPMKTGANPPLRISELGWFKREHRGRRSSRRALKRHGAKSMSECNACHRGADRGYYEDD